MVPTVNVTAAVVAWVAFDSMVVHYFGNCNCLLDHWDYYYYYFLGLLTTEVVLKRAAAVTVCRRFARLFVSCCLEALN